MMTVLPLQANGIPDRQDLPAMEQIGAIGGTIQPVRSQNGNQLFLGVIR